MLNFNSDRARAKSWRKLQSIRIFLPACFWSRLIDHGVLPFWQYFGHLRRLTNWNMLGCEFLRILLPVFMWFLRIVLPVTF